MVKFASTFVCALLATAVSASPRHDQRHHEHRRRKAPCTTSDIPNAPYGMGNSTSAGPTAVSSTTTISATSTVTSVITVVPVQSGSGASPSGGSGSGGSGSGISSSALAGGSGSGGSGPECGPATVTVTAQNTVTVTAGAGDSSPSSSAPVVSLPPSSAPAAPSSSEAAAASSSSAVASSSSVVAPSPSPQPVESSSSAAPVAVSSTSAAAASEQPAPTPESSSTEAPSSTSAASSASSSPASAPSGGKCGIAFTESSQVGSGTPFDGSSSAGWAYNWYYSAEGLPSGIEYVPSLQKPEWTSDLVSALGSASGVQYIKSINEPDVPSGSGGTQTTPSDAVQLYTGTLNALSGQYKIGTPSVTSYDTTSGLAGFASGLTWLSQFKDACAGNCNIGFVDLHWYAEAATGNAQQQADAFMSYVQSATSKAQELFGSDVEIWMSEFSAYPLADTDPQTNIDFLNAVIPQLATSSISRYAYYMAEFLESGSSLTGVGNALMSSGGSS
ncbi:hypothetical protein MMC10_005193 [Thelotrema lepadinum]|nr:hypothetical protein [Thelotrema lepadinum]